MLKPSKRIKLEVGDYSTKKLHNRFHIERKSLMDLYQSITKNHLRFKHEFIRAHHNEIELVVVVEGTKKAFEEKAYYRGIASRSVSGETLIKIVNSTSHKHKIEFKWYADRAAAQRATVRLLLAKERALRVSHR